MEELNEQLHVEGVDDDEEGGEGQAQGGGDDDVSDGFTRACYMTIKNPDFYL